MKRRAILGALVVALPLCAAAATPSDPGARTPMDLPVSRAVARVIEDAAGSPIVQLPTLGGSIPMYLFVGKLKTPTVGIPISRYFLQLPVE